MFARVFPILRLPRRFGVFDYSIPDALTVSPGDIIQIPFRHRTVLGIVASVTPTTTEKRTLPITSGSIGYAIDLSDLHRIEHIASELGQSVASILTVAYEGVRSFPGAPSSPSLKRYSAIAQGVTADRSTPSASPDTIAAVHSILDRLKTDRSLAVATNDETFCVLATALCKTLKNQILIVVPRERDARVIKTILERFSPVVLTGKVKPNDRNSIIRSWRSGTTRILIGTRQSTLIAPKTLDAVLVYQSACDDHQSLMRNPHIDAVRVAEQLAKTHNALFITGDVLPSPSATLPLIVTNDGTDVTLIDVVHKSEYSPYPLLSQTLLESIKIALQNGKKVLLSFNRKGVAKRMECKACGHVPFCGTCGSLPTVRLDDLLCTACGSEMWKPEICPACQSPKIGLKSIGGAKIADDLAKAFPDAIIGHIQKGQIDRTANILIATEFFWSSVTEPFLKWNFGLVAEILADMSFTPGDFRGAEHTARNIARLRQLASREKAECLVQTVARDRLQTLLGVEHVTKTELASRKTYSLPPYGVVVSFSDATRDILPEAISASVVDRNDALTAKIDHATFATWQSLFPTIPDSVKIIIEQ